MSVPIPAVCSLCGQLIEYVEVETTDAAIRPAWMSGMADRGRGGLVTLTTMCGLGVSEEIPPTRNHRPKAEQP